MLKKAKFGKFWGGGLGSEIGSLLVAPHAQRRACLCRWWRAAPELVGAFVSKTQRIIAEKSPRFQNAMQIASKETLRSWVQGKIW